MRNTDPNTPSNGIITHMAVIQGMNDANAAINQKKQLRQNVLINIGCVILGAILGKLPEIFNWICSLLNQK